MYLHVMINAERYNTEKELMMVQDIMNDLENMLKTHDWYFAMSDHNYIYDRGMEQMDRILDRIKTLTSMGYEKEAKELYNQHKPSDI